MLRQVGKRVCLCETGILALEMALPCCFASRSQPRSTTSQTHMGTNTLSVQCRIVSFLGLQPPHASCGHCRLWARLTSLTSLRACRDCGAKLPFRSFFLLGSRAFLYTFGQSSKHTVQLAPQLPYHAIFTGHRCVVVQEATDDDDDSYDDGDVFGDALLFLPRPFSGTDASPGAGDC